MISEEKKVHFKKLGTTSSQILFKEILVQRPTLVIWKKGAQNKLKARILSGTTHSLFLEILENPPVGSFLLHFNLRDIPYFSSVEILPSHEPKVFEIHLSSCEFFKYERRGAYRLNLFPQIVAMIMFPRMNFHQSEIFQLSTGRKMEEVFDQFEKEYWLKKGVAVGSDSVVYRLNDVSASGCSFFSHAQEESYFAKNQKMKNGKILVEKTEFSFAQFKIIDFKKQKVPGIESSDIRRVSLKFEIVDEEVSKSLVQKINFLVGETGLFQDEFEKFYE